MDSLIDAMRGRPSDGARVFIEERVTGKIKQKYTGTVAVYNYVIYY